MLAFLARVAVALAALGLAARLLSLHVALLGALVLGVQLLLAVLDPATPRSVSRAGRVAIAVQSRGPDERLDLFRALPLVGNVVAVAAVAAALPGGGATRVSRVGGASRVGRTGRALLRVAAAAFAVLIWDAMALACKVRARDFGVELPLHAATLLPVFLVLALALVRAREVSAEDRPESAP